MSQNRGNVTKSLTRKVSTDDQSGRPKAGVSGPAHLRSDVVKLERSGARDGDINRVEVGQAIKMPGDDGDTRVDIHDSFWRPPASVAAYCSSWTARSAHFMLSRSISSSRTDPAVIRAVRRHIDHACWLTAMPARMT